MSKNFITGFDSLISDTSKKEKIHSDINKKHDIKDNTKNYERVTIAIDSENLKKIRMICLSKKLKFRDVINDLISDFITKNNLPTL